MREHEAFDKGFREGYLRGLRDGERAALEYEERELPEGAATASIAFVCFMALGTALIVLGLFGALK